MTRIKTRLREIVWLALRTVGARIKVNGVAGAHIRHGSVKRVTFPPVCACLVRNFYFTRALNPIGLHRLRHNITDRRVLGKKRLVAVKAFRGRVEPVVATALDALASEPHIDEKAGAAPVAGLGVAKMTARLAPVIGKACFAVRGWIEITTTLAHPGIVAVSMVVA